MGNTRVLYHPVRFFKNSIFQSHRQAYSFNLRTIAKNHVPKFNFIPGERTGAPPFRGAFVVSEKEVHSVDAAL